MKLQGAEVKDNTSALASLIARKEAFAQPTSPTFEDTPNSHLALRPLATDEPKKKSGFF